MFCCRATVVLCIVRLTALACLVLFFKIAVVIYRVVDAVDFIEEDPDENKNKVFYPRILCEDRFIAV